MKKRIKIFIITYDNNEILNDVCLNSLFVSNFDEDDVEVIILDNHSGGHIYQQYANKVNHIRNLARPDFSTGHLARSWNQAIMHGFKDLNNPDCDAIICVQVDSGFTTNWYGHVKSTLEKNTFIQEGCGDQFMIFTPHAVKRIGLFDERFCNICFQEADYFLRAILFNTSTSSINDFCHQRLWRTISNRKFLLPSAHGAARRDKAFVASSKYTKVSENFFKRKWGIDPNDWENTGIENIFQLRPLIESYITYPYFEKDIITLKEQGFIYDFDST